MFKKSPSKQTVPSTSKSKKSGNKERDKKKIHFMGEPSGSSCSSNEKIQMSIVIDNEHSFAGFGPETIQCIAEQFSGERVSDDICATLAEDITYKMRELLHAVGVNMRHAKRKYVKVEDVNTVFKRFNLERIYGPSLPNWETFGDPDNLSCIPDKPVNLQEIATAETKFTEPGDTGINYKWLTDKSLFNQLLVNNSLNNYSQKIMNAAISNKKSLRMYALKDVTKNNNIGPIIPHLCNFCFFILQKNITYSHLATPILHLLEAIMFNPCTSFSVEEKQITLLIYLLLENIMNATNNLLDDVIPICRTLGRLCTQWPKGAQTVVEKVNKYLLREETIRRLSAPVICALTYIGNDALNVLLWPNIDAMFKNMRDMDPSECLHLRAVILNAASIMYKQDEWDINADRALHMEFGDSLHPLWRNSGTNSTPKETNEPQELSTEEIWFNIKKALLKTYKIHSQQQVSYRSSQLKLLFRKATPQLRRRINQNIIISGYNSVSAKRKTLVTNEDAYNDVIKLKDSVNVISGRRTLFTLKRTYSVNNMKCNRNVRDMLYMM